ncbi:MAG: signal peptide peptidase SppA [Alistipes putredinis]|nr:MAG: signal peptide peptidase SppA [Alistipes putredinis]
MYMLTIMIFAGLLAIFSSPAYTPKTDSVLRLNVGTVTDSPSAYPLGSIDFSSMSVRNSTSLLSALNALEYAATDPNIKGLYINLDDWTQVSGAALEELRGAVLQFKSSGKFVVAYGDSYSQMEYYLASAADKVYVNPQGTVDLHGLTMQVMFYKGLLDKLGVEPIVIRHGTYKAAVEPYITDRMSEANREQNKLLAETVWNSMLGEIAASRGLSAESIDEWINTLSITSARVAQEKGLVDGLLYKDQVEGILSRLVSMSGDDDTDMARKIEEAAADTVSGNADLEIVQFPQYAASLLPDMSKSGSDKVAVIYADGQIVDGEGGQNDVIGSEQIAGLLAEAREDDKIKAVVLRVNSPGGSALAAEVMWREVELLRQSKPVVVSMGAYAASGGYYISCPADVIFADNFTLTGSIGVFGMYMNAGKALKDKLGITVDGVNTNTYSDMGSVFRGMSAPEKAYAHNMVEQVYDTFVGHVAEGRNLTVQQVDAIGQGRVWSGRDAMRIGLVDEIGGLKSAVAVAADRAGIAADFRIEEITAPQDTFSMLLNALGGVKTALVKKRSLGEGFELYDKVMRIKRTEDGVQARMPFDAAIY